jgi:GT2 family glycosyltransferase/PAS domain-containing protein
MTTDNETISTSSDSLTQENQSPEESPTYAWPTVVAVVVTHDPGDWLEECLASLNNEDYPDLTTLVFDVGSKEDLSERVAQAMPTALIRRSEEDFNFAHAINVALDSIEGATYVLVCHDDVIIEPGSIVHMVEEAFRSNASIVGPKIIDADNPDVLLEVGGMIDRFGVPFSGIETDEVDQGQHDGVRDVFFVSSAAMLVRADLFRALGGFDEQCFPGAEDIDLAWRAHLVGARVLVQPSAVVRHHKASDRQRKARTSSRGIVARHRMRAVVKNSSWVSLAWILPLSFVLHTIEGIVWLIRLDPRRSFLLFSGWLWNLKHFNELRKTRSSIQKTREVPDHVVANYQISGSARMRRFFTGIVRSRQINKITKASKDFATTTYTNRTSETPFFLGAFLVYLIAIRTFFTDGMRGIGSLTRWPEFSTQFDALIHGGLPVGEEPMYSSTFSRLVALMLTGLTLGNEGLAQTLFVVSLIPIGCLGVRMLMNDRDVVGRANTVGAIVYGTFGVGIYAMSQGSLDTIILLATIPFFLRALSNRRIRQTGIVAGLMIAFVPSAVTLCIVLGAAFSLVGHQAEKELRKTNSLQAFLTRVRFVAVSLGIAFLINIGWIIDVIGGIDRSALGLSDASLSLREYIFPNVSMTVFALVTAFVTISALLVCRNDRVSDVRVLTVTFGLLFAVAGFLNSIDQPLLDASTLMAVMQLSCALSVAVCLYAYFDEMKLRSFGIAHIANALAVVAVLITSVASIWVIDGGSLGTPQRSWTSQIDLSENARVVYLGDSRVLPGRSVLAPLNRSFLIAGSAHPTISSTRVGPASSLDDEFRDIYSAIMARDTPHGGRLLARLGIESVVVPTSVAPGEKVIAQDSALLAALDSQTDLVRLRDRDGLIVYENSAMSKTFPLDQRAETLSANEVLETSTPPEIEPTTQPWSITTLIVAAISLVMFATAFAWPRRRQLLKTTSSSFQKVSSRVNDTMQSKNDSETSSRKNKDIDLTSEESHDKPTVDLVAEHEKDYVKEEAHEVRS